jgi:transcription elongation factor Elf1
LSIIVLKKDGGNIMGELKLDGYVCERCNHIWVSRIIKLKEKRKPLVCPKCKSPYWDIPRKNKKGGKKNE